MRKCGWIRNARMHGVPEGDGRWWWALNGCTNQPEGWPLGPVVGQTALGAGMAGTDGQVQMLHDLAGVGGIMVPSINHLGCPVWRLSACLESGIIYDIPFNMQNPSKIPLKLKLGNSKVPQTTS